jgi:hypothetical protein
MAFAISTRDKGASSKRHTLSLRKGAGPSTRHLDVYAYALESHLWNFNGHAMMTVTSHEEIIQQKLSFVRLSCISYQFPK